MDMVSAGELPGLPTGWCWSTLGSVLPINYGKALPERDRVSTGTIPVFGSSGCVGSHSESIAPADSILIGRKGSAGSVFFSNVPSWPIDTAYFTAGSPPVDIRYGYWFLRFHQLAKLDQSTAIPSLSRDIYDVQRIPLAPLAEQRRIVARIDALFAEIAEGEAALAEARKGLDIFRRALLKAAVTGELTRDWRAANPASETGHDLLARIADKRARNEAAKRRFRRADDVKFLDVTALPMIPETWTWTTLGALFDISTGSTPSRTESAFWGGDIPWVSSGEVAFCRIRSTRETISAAGLGNPTTRLNPIGTVLLAMIGEGKTRGQCAILDVPAANNQNAAAIRVAGTPIPPEFVYHVLEERYFTSRRESQGGNQPALNAGKVADMPIPLPPLREIDEILRCISESTVAYADTLAMLDAEATDAARLKQSILKAAFEGRLVPQDPTDEPASALLARLAADRSDVSGKRGRAKSARSKGLALQ